MTRRFPYRVFGSDQTAILEIPDRYEPPDTMELGHSMTPGMYDLFVRDGEELVEPEPQHFSGELEAKNLQVPPPGVTLHDPPSDDLGDPDDTPREVTK